jgi:hypothetical protein
MSQQGASHTKQGPTWQLLLELLPAAGAAGDHQPLKQVTNALWTLGLQPAEVERIGQTMTEALRKARQREEWDPAHVLVRVWISGGSTTTDSVRSGSEAYSVRPRKEGGWGFFLLERHEGDQTTQGMSHRIIELYLYQESSLAKKTRSETNPKMERKEK